MAAFMGRTFEEWREIEKVYTEVEPILDTPEGQKILLLGRIRQAEQSLAEQQDYLAELKEQLESL